MNKKNVTKLGRNAKYWAVPALINLKFFLFSEKQIIAIKKVENYNMYDFFKTHCLHALSIPFLCVNIGL